MLRELWRKVIEGRPSLRWLLHRLGLLPAQTQTTAAERALMARLARGRRCLAEIGVFEGVSARAIGAAMAADGDYFAIDPYPRGRLGVCFVERIARREVARGVRARVHWIRLRGCDAARHPAIRDRGFDFLFIDGDHTWEGLEADWRAWRERIAPGGCVALHDTRGGRAPCEAYARAHVFTDPEFRIEHEVDSLTVLRRLDRR